MVFWNAAAKLIHRVESVVNNTLCKFSANGVWLNFLSRFEFPIQGTRLAMPSGLGVCSLSRCQLNESAKTDQIYEKSRKFELQRKTSASRKTVMSPTRNIS